MSFRFSWLRVGSNSDPLSICKHRNGFLVYIVISSEMRVYFNFQHPLQSRECWFLTTKAIEYETLPHESRERAHVIVQIPSRANSWVVVMETFQGVTYDLPCCSIPPRPLISQLIVIEIGDKRVLQSCASTPHTITVIQQTLGEGVTF